MIPKRVTVGPFTYDILHAYSAEESGWHDNAGLTIAINDRSPVRVQQETLVHELLHAILEVTGARYVWCCDENGKHDENREEGLVRTLSPALFDVLRRNPRMIEFLQEN